MKGAKLPILIISGILVFCCLCCCSFFFLFGYLDSGDQCVYKGPLASNAGNCGDSSDVEVDVEPRDDDTEDADALSEDVEILTDEDADALSEDGLVYDGDNFSFVYPNDWSLNDTTVDTVVLSPGGTDNLRISYDGANTFQNLTKFTCDIFAESFLGEYEGLFDAISDAKYKFEKVGGNDACVITGIEVTTGGQKILQDVYYIVNDSNESEAITVILSVDGNASENSLKEFRTVVDSLEVN